MILYESLSNGYFCGQKHCMCALSETNIKKETFMPGVLTGSPQPSAVLPAQSSPWDVIK